MDKVASLTILAIFTGTISYAITSPLLHQINSKEFEYTTGRSNHNLQVSNNLNNLLLRIMKRGGRGCILNLGLSHNCDYQVAIGIIKNSTTT